MPAAKLDTILASMAEQTAGVLAANFLSADIDREAVAAAAARVKGHGLPPGAAATGHVDAMPMYAGESAAVVPAVEPVARVIESWCAVAGAR